MKKTTLPSWIGPAPHNWGTTEHGKLSADQWRVLCTIHLPISLVLQWADASPRYQAMLLNFMDLVTAVRIASVRTTNEEYTVLYEHHIFSYLNGVLELFMDADIKPNHHLSLHLGQFLRTLGPVHAYRAFAFERINYMMQQMETNAKHGNCYSNSSYLRSLLFFSGTGELERTFLLTACRNANLRVLLEDERVAHNTEGLLRMFRRFTDGNRRGTRLSDFRNPGQRLKLLGQPRAMSVDVSTNSALDSFALGTLNFWTDFRVGNRRKVDTYKKIVVSGVVFQTHGSAPGDSFITFENGDEIWNGSIQTILLPQGISDASSALLLVQVFEPLSAEDQENDLYRMWGFAGGELVYDCFLERPVVIQPSQILGHIAKTDVGPVFGVQRPCVHTLPLDQVMSVASRVPSVTHIYFSFNFTKKLVHWNALTKTNDRPSTTFLDKLTPIRHRSVTYRRLIVSSRD